LRVASRSGLVAERKLVAARLADRVLTEQIIAPTLADKAGELVDGAERYRWEVVEDMWPEGALRLLTVRVTFPVQEQECEVLMSTLFDNSTGSSSSTNQSSLAALR
jgi:hypothetical protein